MRHSIFAGAALLFSGSVFAQAPANNCAKNNCYRGVLGTNKGLAVYASHTNDCSSALVCTTTMAAVTTTMMETVTPTATSDVFTTPSTETTTTTTPSEFTTTTTTPSPVIVTTTVTPTVTVTATTVSAFDKRSLGRRQGGGACPGFVLPSYAATACTNFARFSSVCSCAGVTATTSTVNMPVVTVTSTMTLATTTVTRSNTAAELTSTVTSTAPTVTTTVISTVETSTTTTTTSASTETTTTTTFSMVPSPTCNNAGLQYAYYVDNQAAGPNRDSLRVDPTVVKNRTPVTQGTTTSIGINIVNPVDGTTYDIYGTQESGLNFILNHRGYFYAPSTGTYTFTASNVDDIVFTWFDSTAKSGWTSSNAAFRVIFDGTNTAPGTGSYQVVLTGGSYTPFRVIYKQAQGNAAFSYSISDPNGQTLVTSGTASNYLFQFSCDGTSAPAYTQPFGAET